MTEESPGEMCSYPTLANMPSKYTENFGFRLPETHLHHIGNTVESTLINVTIKTYFCIITHPPTRINQGEGAKNRTKKGTNHATSSLYALGD